MTIELSPSQPLLIPMKRGGCIALTNLASAQSKSLPVIIAHGTISNAETVQQLAIFLADEGFNCWVLEWGGHGKSKAASTNQNFEYPAFNDFPTAVESVLGTTGADQYYWISHSGGGHLPLMYYSRYPEEQSRLAGIAALGLQATDAALKPYRKLQMRALMAATSIIGYTPKFVVPVGNEGEPTKLLAQWCRWCIDERWLGLDGFDYMAGLAKLSFPVFAGVGGNDIIAPESGCRKLFDALAGNDKTWQLFSIENGYSKDFTHGQLVRGRAAEREVFPQIVAWLYDRAVITLPDA